MDLLADPSLPASGWAQEGALMRINRVNLTVALVAPLAQAAIEGGVIIREASGLPSRRYAAAAPPGHAGR